MKRKIVVALGGNALQDSSAFTAEAQEKMAAKTAIQIVNLVEQGHQIIITHGNGPQVGDILLGEEASASPTNARMPLDVCVAMSQGQIGYWLQQTIGDELKKRGIKKSVITVMTQVVVEKDDPAFKDPVKPIGLFYEAPRAKYLARKHGWTVREDAGRGWRRVVPSPQPVRIVEIDTLNALMDQGIIAIAVGGGGVSVLDKNDNLSGIEAVVDKDFAAAKLAEDVGADTLLILTNLEYVSVEYRTPEERNIGRTSVSEMEGYVAEGQFAPGSMLPKVQAAIQFAKKSPKHTTVITSLNKATQALAGETGTIITVHGA